MRTVLSCRWRQPAIKRHIRIKMRCTQHSTNFVVNVFGQKPITWISNNGNRHHARQREVTCKTTQRLHNLSKTHLNRSVTWLCIQTCTRSFAWSLIPMAPITLYTAGTPNGFKASVTLEELGIDYETHPIDLSSGEQKQEWFLKINPNGRIPALGRLLFQSPISPCFSWPRKRRICSLRKWCYDDLLSRALWWWFLVA